MDCRFVDLVSEIYFNCLFMHIDYVVSVSTSLPQDSGDTVYGNNCQAIHKSTFKEATLRAIGPATKSQACFLPPFSFGSMATKTAVLAVLTVFPSS